MNVVMLGPFGLHPKGTMRARALPAARALARRGHRVTVVMPPWHTPGEAGRAWADGESGVALEYVSLSGLGLPLVGHLIVASRMARRARALGAEVVHAFKPKAYSGLAATWLQLASRGGRRAAVVMDTDDWEGPGGWNDLEPYGAAQRRLFAWQERHGLRRARLVTVASRELETLAWALGVPRSRVVYAPNALDRLPPEESHDGEAPRLLLYTRFFEFALERPLEVLSIVRRHHPTARLAVVGRGLFGEEKRFAEIAAGRGLADAVEMHGWLEPDRARALFGGCRVALYPFDDTLVNRTKSPVKLLELMGSGLPVVAEAVGELREVIQHGRSGLLAASGDVAALGALAAQLLAEPERARRLGEGARARIAERYLWDDRVADLTAAYDRARRPAA